MFVERRLYDLVRQCLPGVELGMASYRPGTIVLHARRGGAASEFAVDLFLLTQVRHVSLRDFALYVAGCLAFAFWPTKEPHLDSDLHQGPHRGGPGAAA